MATSVTVFSLKSRLVPVQARVATGPAQGWSTRARQVPSGRVNAAAGHGCASESTGAFAPRHQAAVSGSLARTQHVPRPYRGACRRRRTGRAGLEARSRSLLGPGMMMMGPGRKARLMAPRLGATRPARAPGPPRPAPAGLDPSGLPPADAHARGTRERSPLVITLIRGITR